MNETKKDVNERYDSDGPTSSTAHENNLLNIRNGIRINVKKIETHERTGLNVNRIWWKLGLNLDFFGKILWSNTNLKEIS